MLPYIIYSALFASTSDARWHKTGHGTAFRTDWMNNTLYEIASFMVMRESMVWRWSHTRPLGHDHRGTGPRGSVPRPANLMPIAKKFLSLGAYPKYWAAILRHTRGVMSAAEQTYIPATEFPKIYFKARVYVALSSPCSTPDGIAGHGQFRAR